MINGHPVFFGGVQHLFGWFAQGQPECARRVGVLLCPPLGHEHVCSHGAFRALSDRLAGAGFAVLRFDYAGTGNSGGTADDAGLVDGWERSVAAGADELRRLSGCDRLAFVGLRFGATLAYAAATNQEDVDSLVLWSPCTSGRSFARQTRMLAMTSTERTEELIPECDGIEAAGFHFSAETVSDMRRLDMLSLGKPAGRALLLTSAEASRDEKLIAHLETLGVSLDEQEFGGYAAFMVSPVHSVLPEGALDRIVEWLAMEYPASSEHSHVVHDPAGHSATPERERQLPGDAVHERAVTFADGRLFGILTEPTAGAQTERGRGISTVVLLNTGADHHVGPHRLFVPLARDWARGGFRVLRFDLAGIGDSHRSEGSATTDAYPESALDDVRAAVTYLRDEVQADDIFLVGMCSGAYHAVHSAGLGVSGIIAVNPPLYWTPGEPIDSDPFMNEAETRRVGRALLSAAKWQRLLRGRVDVRYNAKLVLDRFRNVSVALVSALRGLVATSEPDHDVQRSHDSLFPAAVATCLIFSSGDPSLTHFQRTQRARMPELRARDNFTVDVISGADHTFMPLKWQRLLTPLLTERLMELRTQTSATAPG